MPSIPDYLRGKVWHGSPDSVNGMLKSEPIGTFAFYRFEKQRTDGYTREQALRNALGNEELADRLMVQADDSKLGIAYVAEAGTVLFGVLSMSDAAQFKSISSLAHSIAIGGTPINPRKFFDFYSGYQVQTEEDVRKPVTTKSTWVHAKVPGKQKWIPGQIRSR